MKRPALSVLLTFATGAACRLKASHDVSQQGREAVIKQDNDKDSKDKGTPAAPTDIIQSTGNDDAVVFEAITNPAEKWMVETWGGRKKKFNLPDDQKDAMAFQKQAMAKKFLIYAVATGQVLK